MTDDKTTTPQPPVSTMRAVECCLCGGAGYGYDDHRCTFCAGRGYVLTDGVERETK